MTTLYQHYLQLKTEHPGCYARDLAKMMGISEAELTQARADEAQPLRADFPALLNALKSVGEIKSITRNEYAVHEQIGTFDNLHPGPHAGLVLNPRHLDLRFSWQNGTVFSACRSRAPAANATVFRSLIVRAMP